MARHEPREIAHDPRLNALLGHLSEDDRRAFCEGLLIVTVDAGDVLFADGEPLVSAYFPLTAVISMIALMRNGQEIEYGSIGREGMLGLQSPLRAQRLRGRAMCQLAGEVLIVPATKLARMKADEQPELFRLLLRYAQSTINVLAQSTACNGLHSVHERTARWLLSTRDRAGNDHFDLTQEFLSMMLGVRRSGVTGAAGDFRRDGIIDYGRGAIQILDPPRLVAAACECYAVIAREYARVFEN